MWASLWHLATKLSPGNDELTIGTGLKRFHSFEGDSTPSHLLILLNPPLQPLTALSNLWCHYFKSFVDCTSSSFSTPPLLSPISNLSLSSPIFFSSSRPKIILKQSYIHLDRPRSLCMLRVGQFDPFFRKPWCSRSFRSSWTFKVVKVIEVFNNLTLATNFAFKKESIAKKRSNAKICQHEA